MITLYTQRKAQRKLDDIQDELFVQGIQVKLTYTDFGIEVIGDPVDVLLAKKELRTRCMVLAP